ncbi:MAG: hypothetical protein JSR65_07640 [Proteobacteria bacterium]|nr:hypothetical protein [Pseudomonadota bacterium]
MKRPMSIPASTLPVCDARRRSVFKFAALLSGIALLPRVARSVARIDAPSDVWLARVDDAGRLHRVQGASDAAGAFRLRTQAAHAHRPFALDADYGDGIAHRFWYAWRGPDGGMAQSHHAALTCHAQSTGLSLSVRADGRDVPFAIPAVAGTYVLAIANDGHGLAALDDVHLLAATSDRGNDRLRCRSTQASATFSHVVFSVEPLAV